MKGKYRRLCRDVVELGKKQSPGKIDKRLIESWVRSRRAAVIKFAGEDSGYAQAILGELERLSDWLRHVQP